MPFAVTLPDAKEIRHGEGLRWRPSSKHSAADTTLDAGVDTIYDGAGDSEREGDAQHYI